MIFILIWAGLILFVTFVCLIRNGMTLRFRSKIIDAIFKSEDWVRLAKIERSVEYYEMVYKFWKPLRSFYPKEFLEELGL